MLSKSDDAMLCAKSKASGWGQRTKLAFSDVTIFMYFDWLVRDHTRQS